MAMREDCKHFQSRTYASGEIARFCVLDLAPEAPWRCPDDCPSYERRLADVTSTHGSLSAADRVRTGRTAGGRRRAARLGGGDRHAAAPEELAEVESDEDRAERKSQGSG